MWDALRLEKEGIPALVVVHDVFEEAARRQASAGGVPELRLLVYPQPPPGESEDLAQASACKVAAAMREFLTVA